MIVFEKKAAVRRTLVSLGVVCWAGEYVLYFKEISKKF